MTLHELKVALAEHGTSPEMAASLDRFYPHLHAVMQALAPSGFRVVVEADRVLIYDTAGVLRAKQGWLL